MCPAGHKKARAKTAAEKQGRTDRSTFCFFGFDLAHNKLALFVISGFGDMSGLKRSSHAKVFERFGHSPLYKIVT